MTASESLPGGWTNPYRYDGWHRVRYDSETGLYWMSVRAYDPTLGRFLSRDPLNRQPLVFTGQPYVYAGNNPLKNVDPSGQLYFTGDGGGGSSSPSTPTSVQPTGGTDPTDSRDSGCDHSCRVSMAKDVANEAAHNFNNDASIAQLIGLGLGAITLVTEGVGVIADAVPGLEWLGITIGVIGLDV